MILWPCFHCPRKGNCNQEALFRESVSGQDCTLARIRCRWPYDRLPVGQRVEADFVNDRDWHSTITATIRGIVVAYTQFKVKVWFEPRDDSEAEAMYWGDWPPIIRLYPDRLRLAEGTAAVCAMCRRPLHIPEVRCGRQMDGTRVAWEPCDICQGKVLARETDDEP